jgi:hypothetical protein
MGIADVVTSARSPWQNPFNGTPTFFINGQLYEGPHESAALVAELLKASRGR